MATPSYPTNVDAELAGAPRGADLNNAVLRARAQRAPMAMPPERTPTQDAIDTAAATVLTWGDLQQRHPEWRGDYWAECRALYAGGDRLLGDMKVLERLFPRHLHERQDIYRARKDRAHYFAYPGTICDHLLAGLGTDPLSLSFDQIDEKGAVSKNASAEWWEAWITDVTDEAERPADYGLESDGDNDEDDDEGGCTLHHFLVDVLREALQTRTAWVLADLPSVDPDAVIDSQLTAERSGALDPYLCVIPAEQVIDWCCDARGRFSWVLTMTVEQPRYSPRDRRKHLLYTYVLWTPDTWARYEINVDLQNPPHESAAYTPAASGAHGFGRVPIERLVLPEGLYAMGKLHSLAREHLNKRCAMSWAEYKSLFAILYEFLGAEDRNGLPVAEAQRDDQRATNQVRAQGYTQTRGNEDRAEYVGPPVDPFVAARDSCNDLMREMHRVMFSMALSANMDSAALQRSGESKDKDQATTAVLLYAYAVLLRRFARRLLVLASLGRQEAVPSCTMRGLSNFDTEGTVAVIDEAVNFFNGVPQLSPLVKELALARVYERYLGDLTPEQMEIIRQQIRDGLSMEEIMAYQGMMPGAAGNTAGAPGDDEEPATKDDHEDDDGGRPVPTPRGPAGKTQMTRPMAKR